MDELWVDPEQGVAGYGERQLPLSAHEVALLAAFAEAGDRVVTRAELIRRARLPRDSPRQCDAVLVGLRRALEDGAIANVRRRGWRFLAGPVVRVDAE